MNAIDLLISDHREAERLFSEFAADNGEHRADILATLVRELSIHTAIEEAYVYPHVRREVPKGDAYVDESVHEHHQMASTLASLDGKLDKAHTKEVAEQVETLRKKVMHHVHEEEHDMFPAFVEAASQRELSELGKQLREAKESAPTRPHPNQPAATALTSWANGLIDRARDAVAGRAH
jgi:hemerythrin superfamily protein